MRVGPEESDLNESRNIKRDVLGSSLYLFTTPSSTAAPLFASTLASGGVRRRSCRGDGELIFYLYMDSSPGCSLAYTDRLNLCIVRPILAISFVLFFLVLGWLLAWKLLLVHVPLVQEIFGLKKKPFLPKPSTRHRFSRFYNTLSSLNSNISAP